MNNISSFMEKRQSRQRKSARTSQQRRFECMLAKSKQFQILRYESFDTLKLSDKNRSCYIQTDINFIQDVQKIANIRKNKVFSILSSDKNVLTNQDCDQIDYKARIHRQASIVNTTTNLNFEKINENDRCECGCRRGRGDPLPYCTDEQTLNVLGPGVLLMFLFKKAIFCILMMMLIVYGIYALATNLMGSEAIIDQQCAKSQFCSFKHNASDENKSPFKYFYVAQFWLGFVFSFIWVITLRFIKFLGKMKNDEVDKKLRSASDYAIMIQNLPTGNYSEHQLLDFLDDLYGEIQKVQNEKRKKKQNFRDEVKSNIEYKNPFNMKSIQIIYNMQFSRVMVQQISDLCCSVDSLFEKGEGEKNTILQKNVEEYMRDKTRLKECYELLMDLRKRFLNDAEFRKKLSTSACIIEFDQQKKRKQLLKHFGNSRIGVFMRIQMRIKKFFSKGGKDLIFKGSVLRIERAPEPSDIIWTNCQKTFQVRRIITIYIATFFIVTVSFGFLIGLQFLQSYLKKTYDNVNLISFINLAMSVSLLIVNKILWFILFYLLEIEYNHTLTEKIISQMNKVLLASSVNVIALPLIANIVVNQNLYGSDGLSGMVFDYHISVIGGLLVMLFDPIFLIKKIVMWIKCIRNSMIRLLCGNLAHVNPQKGVKVVNEFYEGNYFDVAQNYVYITGAILHAAFFCPLQPFIIVLVTIMVFFVYVINRFKILRYCKIPEMTELLVFETVLSQAAMVPLMYGAGSIVIAFIQRRLNKDIEMPYISSLICIAIGLIGIFNPGDFLNKIVKKIMKSCKCLVVVPGEDINDDDSEDEQEQYNEEYTEHQLNPQIQKPLEEQSFQNKFQLEDQIVAKKDLIAVPNKEKTDRIEVYYEDSNSLSLLGFQKTLKGEETKVLMGELQNFCEGFFPPSLTHAKVAGAGLTFSVLMKNRQMAESNEITIVKKSKFHNQRVEENQSQMPGQELGMNTGQNFLGSLFPGNIDPINESNQNIVIRKKKRKSKD